MRLFGLDIRRSARLADTPPPSASQPTVTTGRPVTVSTRSYWSPFQDLYQPGKGSPTAYIQDDVELAVYDVICKSVPFIDVALRKLARMIAPFGVACDNEATQENLNAWIDQVPSNWLFDGFTPFARRYVRANLQYGRSAGEIALAQNKREVGGLFNIDSKRIRLIPAEGGQLLLGEEDQFGTLKAYDQQDLFLYSALNGEGDNPNGVSILRSIPFVADMLLRMENATRQKWQRQGAPSFLWHAKFDPGTLISPDALDKARSNMQDGWDAAQEARYTQEGIIDFFNASQADLTVKAIDSSGELNFNDPYRAMAEQIVSSTELAPFMLGLQWSTTERLSQQQADAIMGMVESVRTELEPDFARAVDWQQRLAGWRGNTTIAWQDVSLQDRVETARADLFEAQAQEKRNANADWLWKRGGVDQLGALNEAGYEVEAVVTPMDGPPAAPVPLAQGQPGGGGQPPQFGQQSWWDRYP